MKKLLIIFLVILVSPEVFSQKRTNLLFNPQQESMYHYVLVDTILAFKSKDNFVLLFEKNKDYKETSVSLDSLGTTSFTSIDSLIAQERKSPFYIQFELDSIYIYEVNEQEKKVIVNRAYYVEVTE